MAASLDRSFKLPVLRITRVENATAMLIAVFASLATGVAGLVLIWGMSRPKLPPPAAEITPFVLPGGDAHGQVDETLKVESEEQLDDDPSITSLRHDDHLHEVLQRVEQVSKNAIAVTPPSGRHSESGAVTARTVGAGSASPLGTKGRVTGSQPSERWLVTLGGSRSVDEYARRLDFFGIRLGALVPGRFWVLSGLSASTPLLSMKTDGSGFERVLVFSWHDARQQQADVELFQRAGHDARGMQIVHFYPQATEDILARLELEFRNRPASEIRRTYFSVKPHGDGFKFVVTRQTYLR